MPEKHWTTQKLHGKKEHPTYQEVTDFPLSFRDWTTHVFGMCAAWDGAQISGMPDKHFSNWSTSQPSYLIDASKKPSAADVVFYKCFPFSSRRKSSFVTQLFLPSSFFFLNLNFGEKVFLNKLYISRNSRSGFVLCLWNRELSNILKLLELSKWSRTMSYWVCCIL